MWAYLGASVVALAMGSCAPPADSLGLDGATPDVSCGSACVDGATPDASCTPTCTIGSCGDDGCGGRCPCMPGTSCGAGDVCTPCYTACPVVCGDGGWMPGEACEDGNFDAGDGCDPSCEVEDGWVCDVINTFVPTVCHRIVCGDGRVDPPEQCEDGGAAPGDGCSDTCRFEPGMTCTGTYCFPIGGGTCASPLRTDPGTTASPNVSVYGFDVGTATWTNDFGGWTGACDLGTEALAGDAVDGIFAFEVPPLGVLEFVANHVGGPTPPRQYVFEDCADAAGTCVDGIVSPGYGYGTQSFTNLGTTSRTAYVVVEVPASEVGPNTEVSVLATVEVPLCGDVRVQPGETCDIGAVSGNPGCSADCVLTPGWACRLLGADPCYLVTCGDGRIDPPEACDDGNVQAGDGCASDCATVEAGFACTREPSSCGLAGETPYDSCGWPLAVSIPAPDAGSTSQASASLGAVDQLADDLGPWPAPCTAIGAGSDWVDFVLAVDIPPRSSIRATATVDRAPGALGQVTLGMFLTSSCDTSGAAPVVEVAACNLGSTIAFENAGTSPITKYLVVEVYRPRGVGNVQFEATSLDPP